MAGEVLAVVVVYQRDLDLVPAWRWLQRTLAPSRALPHGGLRLDHVLVYDNSDRPRARPGTAADDRVSYRHDADNGGTAAAYALAARMAQQRGIEWLLLLDHDTSLPPDLLDSASSALKQRTGAPTGALLPWVNHADKVISPSSLSIWGSIQPLRRGAEPKHKGRLTGIASGSLVRTRALGEIFPPPSPLWLDYVDHWLFSQLQNRGWPIIVFASQIEHDLSLLDFARIPPSRLRSIIDGETRFTTDLSWPARLVHPFRLLARALKYASANRDLALMLLSAAARACTPGSDRHG
jgi:Glycosyl transferase family 2